MAKQEKPGSLFERYDVLLMAISLAIIGAVVFVFTVYPEYGNAMAGKVMYFLQIPALTGDADRSGFDVLIDALLPAQATALKLQLTASLDPTNPSGNTYLVNLRD